MNEWYLFIDATCMTSLGVSGILPAMRIADLQPKHLKALVSLSHFSFYWWLFDWFPLFSTILADGALLDLCLLGRPPLLPRVDVLTWLYVGGTGEVFPLAHKLFPISVKIRWYLVFFCCNSQGVWTDLGYFPVGALTFHFTDIIWSLSRLVSDGKRRGPIHDDRPSSYTI